MDIFKHIPVPEDFKHLRRYLRLLSPEYKADKNVNCVFIRKNESFIELENSHHMLRYIQMPDNLLLGYNFIWRSYDSYPWYGRNIERGYQCGLWDLNTGERILTLKGLHYGSPLGVQFLDDERLITWGDDFLINIWDRKTGECLEKMPVGIGTRSDYKYPEAEEDEKLKDKLWGQEIDANKAERHKKTQERMSDEDFDEYMEEEAGRLAKQTENNKKYSKHMKGVFQKYGDVPFVKSDTFSGWTDERRKAYVENRHELSFSLKFVLPKTDDNTDTVHATYEGSDPNHIKWKAYDGFSIWDCFDELTDVHAGYSFEQKLKDGRWFVTGETYGMSDKAYIWDGGLNLTMLLLPMGLSSHVGADGQQADGAISYDEGDVQFYDY